MKLKNQLMLGMLFVTTVVILILFSYLWFKRVRDVKQDFLDKKKALEYLTINSLKVPMWDLDDNETGIILDGVFSDAEVAGIKLTNNDGEIIYQRKKNTEEVLEDIETNIDVYHLQFRIGNLIINYSYKFRTKIINDFVVELFIVFIVATLLQIMFSIWMSRYLSEPIIDLTKKIKLIGNGNYEIFKGRTENVSEEVIVLDNAIVKMANSLSDAFHKISNQNMELSDKFDEMLSYQSKIKESEKHYKAIFQQIPVGYQSLNIDGVIIDINHYWMNLFGYKKHDILGKKFTDFMTNDSKNIFEECFVSLKKQCFDRNSIYEIITENKKRKFVSIDASISRDLSGRFEYAHCVIKDITIQKNTEINLRESERNLKAMINAIPEAAYMIDFEGNILLANNKLEKLLKKFNLTDNDSIFNLPFIDKSKFQESLKKSVTSKSTVIYEAKEPNKIINKFIHPIVAENAEVSRFAVISVNISEQKNNEILLTSMNNNLEKIVKSRTEALSIKNNELERLSATISKTLLNPLANIFALIEIVKKYSHIFSDKEDIIKLRSFSQELVNINKVLKNLEYYTGLNERKISREKFIVSEIINESFGEINFKCNKKLAIKADKDLMRYLFNELIHNAIKHTKDCMIKEIVLDGEEKLDEYIIYVKDSGIGFDMSFKDDIFKPFVSGHEDKSLYETGLGLAIAKKIIDMHHGRIWSISEINSGTTIFISLPKS